MQLLLILHVDRDVVVRSCLQELVVLLLGELVILEVVIVAQEGSSSLKVDASVVILQLTNLILLGLDSGRELRDLGAKAHNHSVLLGTLLAKALAVVVE